MLVSARQACAILGHIGLSRGQGLRVLEAGLAGSEQRVFVARRLATVAVDEDGWLGPTAEQATAVAGGWVLCPANLVRLAAERRRHGPMPFVCIVGGFVVLGASITDWQREADGTYRLALGAPGPWFADLRGSRLDLPRGGPWTFVDARSVDRRPVLPPNRGRIGA